MTTIKKEELKNKLEAHENVKLFMALDRRAYEKVHIPGSLFFDSLEEAFENLKKDDEIVVYCTNPICPASYRAYQALRSRGYRKLARYAGGLEDWSTAGYPLEGKMVGSYN